VQFPTGISQRTWSTTTPEVITASLLRANVTAPLWLITSPPMAILAQQLSAASMASGSYLTVNPLDTEILDTGGGHSDVSNPFRCYIPATGWWLIRGAVPFSGASTNSQYSFGAGLFIGHGTSVPYYGARHAGPASSTGTPMPGVADLLPLSAASPVTSGDWFQLQAFQDTGSPATLAINTAVGVFPWVAARWAGVQSGTAGLPVPSPAAFSDTTEITGTFLNGNLRDTVNFLAYPPMARLSNGGASQSVPSGADTAVTWTSSTVTSAGSDNYSGWSSGTNPSRYTFPVAGRYYVSGQVAFPGSTSGQWACGLRVNGTTTWWGTRTSAPSTSTAGIIATAERYLRVNAGDYVEVTGNQSTGSSVALATAAPTYSKLIVLWRGA
jgi:hypothetical protein